MPAANKSQEETLQTFRKQLFDEGTLHEGDSIGTDDETLLRFLRARKFDLPASLKMIRDCQHWRKTVEGVGIDKLYDSIDPFDYPERDVVFEHWPMWFHKTDKKGRPLNVHFYGALNLSKLYAECTPERHWQSVLVNCECLTREILPAVSRKAGKHIGQVFVIVDLKGFSLSQFWSMKSLARSSFQVSQDYFPETMGQVAIINAPSSFTAIYAIMKPWLSKETQEKIYVWGSDYREKLLELVDADNLPKVLGGNCTCHDKEATGDGGDMAGMSEGSRCHLSGAGPWMEGRKGWGPNAKQRQAAEHHKQEQGGILSNTVESNALQVNGVQPSASASVASTEDSSPKGSDATSVESPKVQSSSATSVSNAPESDPVKESTKNSAIPVQGSTTLNHSEVDQRAASKPSSTYEKTGANSNISQRQSSTTGGADEGTFAPSIPSRMEPEASQLTMVTISSST